MLPLDPKTPRFVLIRGRYQPTQITGRLLVMRGSALLYTCATIERAWADNQKGISAVPAGMYRIILTPSPKFKRDLWRLVDVPGREAILIHTANYARQLNGCIGVGKYHEDIDGDGNGDTTQSAKTLEALHASVFPTIDTTIHIIGYEGDQR